MHIRPANAGDAAAINLLIEAVAPVSQQDFGPSGLINFIAPNSIEKIQARIENPDYFTLLCESDDRVVGIITVKTFNKVDQLFVHPDYQRRGIARRLWQNAFDRIKAKGEACEITVKSSTMGIPVYQSFGFERSGNKGTIGDITFYPMSLHYGK